MSATSDGEMGLLIREFDWASTSLGPMVDWPQSLKTIVDLLLTHPMPCLVLWGPDHIQVYNDACARIAGLKHPAALGRPNRESWPEAWHINGPVFDRVLACGESTLLEHQPFPIDRHGHREVAYFTASYGPVRDDAGSDAGVFVTMIETTAGVLAERERDRQEERLRLALEAARMGSWWYEASADRHHRDANLNRLLGRPAEESASPLADFLACIHPDDRERVAAEFHDSVRQGRDMRVEFRAVWPDGSVHWMWDHGSVFGGPDGQYLAGAGVDVTDLKANESARWRDLNRRLVIVQEAERRRVSRDLRDSAGPYLDELGRAFEAVDGGELPPGAAERLAEAKRVVQALTREVHHLADRLGPTPLNEVGLEPALKQLVADFSAQTGTRSNFRWTNLGSGRAPAEVETTLYRAVQEALAVIARSAHASAVGVVVIVRPDRFVSAAIDDDGAGFDLEATPSSRPGLAGLRERVELVGGEMNVQSALSSGTTVFLRFQISGAAEGEP